MLSQKGHLTTHTKLSKKLLSGANFAEHEQDQQTSTLNIDASFGTEIPILSDYRETEPNADTIACYTDGSMMSDKVGAAPVYTSLTQSEMDHQSKCHIILENVLLSFKQRLSQLNKRQNCLETTAQRTKLS